MDVAPKFSGWPRFAIVLSACVFGVSALTQAQPPRQVPRGEQAPSRVDPQVLSRARDACDAAASRAGYRVMRRDRESVNGRAYNLPLHVAYGTNEGDVTCQYDVDRGLATVPPYAEGRGFGRHEGMDGSRAEQMCTNYVNQRRGYRVVQVGTAVRHGRSQWYVPMTVQRNGRRQESLTCRYNMANNKLSLR